MLPISASIMLFILNYLMNKYYLSRRGFYYSDYVFVFRITSVEHVACRLDEWRLADVSRDKPESVLQPLRLEE